MEMNVRARCWVATFPWNDAELPTEAVVPTLPFKLAHAKLSRANDSVSIWFTFANGVRASTISTSLDREHVVLRRVKHDLDLPKFMELPFDWELVSTKLDDVQDGDIDDDVIVPTNVTKSRKRDHPTNPDGVDGASDDEFERILDELRKARKRAKQGCNCIQLLQSMVNGSIS